MARTRQAVRLLLVSAVGGQIFWTSTVRASESSKAIVALTNLAMAKSIDGRCHILTDKEQALLDKIFEYGIKDAGLTAQEEKEVRYINPHYNEIPCDDRSTIAMFDYIRSVLERVQ